MAALRRRQDQRNGSGSSLDQVSTRDQNSSPRPMQRNAHPRSSSRQAASGKSDQGASEKVVPPKPEKVAPSKPVRSEGRSREAEMRRIASKSGHAASKSLASGDADGS